MEVDERQRRSRWGLPIVVLGGIVIAALAIGYLRRRAARGTHVALSTDIDRPVSEVFAFVSDARNALRWLPMAVERRKLTEGPIGLGTRFEGSDRIAGRIVSRLQEIIAFEPDARVTTRITGPGTAEYEIRVEPLDGATRLAIEVTGHSDGIYRLLDLVPASLMTRGYEQAYARLKELLERGEAKIAAAPIETQAEAVGRATEVGATG